MKAVLSGRWWPRLVPRRISAQVALVMVLAVLIIHAVLTSVFEIERRMGRGPGRGFDAAFVTADLLRHAPDTAARQAIFAAALSAFPGVSWERTDRMVAVPGADRDRSPPVVEVGTGEFFKMAPPGRPWLGGLTINLLFLTVSVGLLALWAARQITAPLTAFAEAASRYEPSQVPEPLPERGPREIRDAVRAFNAMRLRIGSLVDDRTRMLAALGHDLRTPLTRLRLHAEFVEDAGQREQMLRDLDQMMKMVDAAVSYLRGERGRPEPVSMDLAACAQTVCDGFADLGFNVVFTGDRLVTAGRPDEIERALTNLVDNAVKYGGSAIVRVEACADEAIVRVLDDGPGIPAAQLEAVTQPFVRGDAARGMSAGSGFGLGLSIARAVAEGHGGRLVLANRSPRGLEASLHLPRARAAPSRG